MAINKVVGSFDEAVADMKPGAILLIGGFGGPSGCPSYLIAAVARKGVRELTIAGNHGGAGMELIQVLRERMNTLLNLDEDWYDPGLLVERGQVRKGILSFPAAPARDVMTPFERAHAAGQVTLELIGQGSLAERIRCARAGIPAFYTPVGVGTATAEGKRVEAMNGVPCLLETALRGDFSLIRAHKADRYGNLVYKGTARTFNAVMAGASLVTVAEVDEVVELGALAPAEVVTPGIYVDRVVVRPAKPLPWDAAC